MGARLPLLELPPTASRLGVPAVIEGSVTHRRVRPARNAFAYRAFCLRLPLSQLDRLTALGIAHNRRGLIAFADRDHGPRDGSPLEPWMRDLLRGLGVDADGEIVLYTFPRMLGYVFNPVSFWVCHDRDARVKAVLAEVSNTFGEHHNYLVSRPDGRPIANGETLVAGKSLHVSPFCAVTGHYRFRFHEDADRWMARIDYHDEPENDEPLIATSISGRATALSPATLRRMFWRHRWFTAGVIARIHWQAMRLWIKRIPYVPKPPPPASSITH